METQLHLVDEERPARQAGRTGTEDRRQSVQSIDVGLRVLDVLACAGVPMALKDIAKGVELAPSQVHRYLRSFVNGQMVVQESASGCYMLGPMALRVGLAALQRLDGIEVGAQILQGLISRWDYTGGIAIWSERGPVVVRWYQAQSFLSPSVGLGTVFPLLGSAVGRVFLAHLPAKRTEPLLRRERRRPVSPYAEPGAVDTKAICTQVREQGYSIIQDHFTPRIRGMAAPIFDLQGRITAAFTIAGRLPQDPGHDPVLEDLKQSAAQVSADIGYRKP